MESTVADIIANAGPIALASLGFNLLMRVFGTVPLELAPSLALLIHTLVTAGRKAPTESDVVTLVIALGFVALSLALGPAYSALRKLRAGEETAFLASFAISGGIGAIGEVRTNGERLMIGPICRADASCVSSTIALATLVATLVLVALSLWLLWRRPRIAAVLRTVRENALFLDALGVRVGRVRAYVLAAASLLLTLALLGQVTFAAQGASIGGARNLALAAFAIALVVPADRPSMTIAASVGLASLSATTVYLLGAMAAPVIYGSALAAAAVCSPLRPLHSRI